MLVDSMGWPVPWPFVSSMNRRLKMAMPKLLPEADALWSGAHERPRP